MPCPPALPAVLPSPYQQALFRLMQGELQRGASAGGGVKGVNNVLMEMRNICNHPPIRQAGREGGCIWVGVGSGG